MDAFHSSRPGPVTQRALPPWRSWPTRGPARSAAGIWAAASSPFVRRAGRATRVSIAPVTPRTCLGSAPQLGPRPATAFRLDGVVAVVHQRTRGSGANRSDACRRGYGRGGAPAGDASGAGPRSGFSDRFDAPCNAAGGVCRRSRRRASSAVPVRPGAVRLERDDAMRSARRRTRRSATLAPRRAWHARLVTGKGGRISAAGNLDPIQKNDARPGRQD
jgi:hypothetical protein